LQSTPKSGQFYARTGTAEPNDSRIKTQFFRFGAVVTQAYGQTPVQWWDAPYDNSFWTGGPGVNDNPSSVLWSYTSGVEQQASRDWATVCGRLWAAPIPTGVKGTAPQPYWAAVWPPYSDWNIDDDRLASQAAAGRFAWFSEASDPSPNTQYRVGQDYSPCEVELGDPGCTTFRGAPPGQITYILARSLVSNGVQIDPVNEFRCEAPLLHPGLVLCTTMPEIGYRPLEPIGQFAPLLPESPAESWSVDPARPTAPNTMLHEGAHALMGVADQLANGTIWISSDTSNPGFNRGYDARSDSPNASAMTNCIVAILRGGIFQ